MKVHSKFLILLFSLVQKPLLMRVLSEARSLKNLLLLSASDHFELCLALCRTSSSSVQHENIYIDPASKHCYTKHLSRPLRTSTTLAPKQQENQEAKKTP